MISVALLLALSGVADAHAVTTTFPPLRHGLKAVFGNHGNDHGGDFEVRIPLMISQLRDLGVDLTRIEFKWAINEPQRGVYDWREADRLITVLHEHGIEPMLMFYCPPPWAMIGPPEDEAYFIRRGFDNLYTVVWARDEYKDDLRRFAEAAARRYRGKTNLFEFWNEPDGMAGPVVLRDESGAATSIRFGGDPVQYTEWLKIFYDGVKAGNPDAQVAAGSLCEPNTHFLEAIYASGGRGHFDAVSVHPYPYGGDQINIGLLHALREVMVRFGDWDKPMWVSEFGWSTGGDFVDPVNPKPTIEMAHQAERIGPMFQMVQDLPYLTQFYFFTLNDWGWTVEDPRGINGFGLVDFYLRKKPSYEAYRKVVATSPRDPRTVTAPELALHGPAKPVDLRPAQAGSLAVTLHRVGSPVDVLVSVRCRALEADVSHALRLGTGETTVDIPIRALPGVAPGVYQMIIGASGAAPDTVRLVVPALARRLVRPPIVDAVLDEWAGGLGIVAERLRAGFAWGDPGLYLACVVESSTHTPGPSNPSSWQDDKLWEYDSLQLGLDPLRDAVRGCRTRPDDSEYLFALTQQGVETRRYAAMEGRHVGLVRNGALAVRHTGRETIYEAFLPWEDIHPGQPAAGDVLGLSLLANVVDKGERRTFAWGDGIADGKLPGRYAAVVLGP